MQRKVFPPIARSSQTSLPKAATTRAPEAVSPSAILDSLCPPTMPRLGAHHRAVCLGQDFQDSALWIRRGAIIGERI